MATEKTNVDAVRFYLTGDCPVNDDSSLGGAISNTELVSLAGRLESAGAGFTTVPTISVDHIYGSNGQGTGVLIGRDLSTAFEVEQILDMNAEDIVIVFLTYAPATNTITISEA